MACPFCQYVGKSSGELDRHARLHSGEKPHRCPHCSFQTVWNSDLARHIVKEHGAESSPHSVTGSDAVKPEVDYNMNVDDSGKRAVGSRIANFIADVSRHAGVTNCERDSARLVLL